MRCKHDFGWCGLRRRESIFIYEDGKVEFNFNRKGKIVAECNRGCGKVRNIYLKAKVKKYGKIRKPNKMEELM